MKDTLPIEKLFNWDKNPRAISKDKFEILKKRILKYGQFKPVLVTEEGEVIGGNMRLRAMRELGITDVWVSVITPKSEAEKIEIALADNDESGHYEQDKLAELVYDFKNDIDLTEFSINLGQELDMSSFLTRYAPDKPNEDETPELTDEPVSKRGEVYILGRHRVMCGDALSEEDMSILMNDKKADLIFSDPPYNVDYTGKTKDALKIQNDVMDENAFYSFLIGAFTNMFKFSKPGACYYMCYGESTGGFTFRKALMDTGYMIKQCIIWNKNSMVMGRQDYQWKHEPILYGWKDGMTHTWYGDRKQVTVWDIDRPSRSEQHPTMKPVELIQRALSNSSKAGDLILDMFGGSGSTLLTCEKIERVCYMMEIDPRYVDVIRKRYAQYIGKENEWEKVTKI